MERRRKGTVQIRLLKVNGPKRQKMEGLRTVRAELDLLLSPLLRTYE